VTDKSKQTLLKTIGDFATRRILVVGDAIADQFI
jgi:hypothetical protein